jgi:endoglucanase
MYRILLGMIIISFLSLPVVGQSYLKTNGKAIVNEEGDTVIIRAMGLGGWMLQEGYMLQTSGFADAQYQIKEKIAELIGEEDMKEFYRRWLANHVRESDIDSMASWGFNAVRLPMHYNLYTLPIDEEPVQGQQTWLDTGFELTDSLVAWCKKNNMYVLLDLHAAPGGQGYASGINDYDPDKPSLWEKKANRDKTKALWKKLAERYADEPAIMGYDLLNEPNWDIPGNALLRQLYKEITDSIRLVDDKHIIFIEGNWFANDFSGLTPPWDDNMVYSPHKYWSYNDPAGLDWVLPIRDAYDVPLFFGESGENSNTWFRDAIYLFESNDLGWAWWPLKKIQSISCPLSIPMTPEYQMLLDYWNGNGPQPSVEFAKATLFELAENVKTENCIYQKDVIDAMFRQVYDDTPIPYNVQTVPGVVYASDFSLGKAGVAYNDNTLADYHVNTDNFTAWNSGWSYRNDGVDIESNSDNINSNGYSVGWIAAGEWMRYDIDLTEPGSYDVKLRVAADNSNGKYHFAIDGIPITSTQTVSSTGGWDKWGFSTLQGLILDEGTNSFEFHALADGFNLSSFEFIRTGNSEDVSTSLVEAYTVDNNTIEIVINKILNSQQIVSSQDFSIRINNTLANIQEIKISESANRIIRFSIAQTLKSTDDIKISYWGDQIEAMDGTFLSNFQNEPVKNTLIFYNNVPGKIEAENYHDQLGIQLENCTDAGGGKNIAYLDPGDYTEYYIEVANSGVYNVEYRTAAQSNTGKITLQIVNENDNTNDLHTVSFAPTGGWQSWQSTFAELELEQGQHKIRLLIEGSQFNINWFDFSFVSSVDETANDKIFNIYPNPGNGLFKMDLKGFNPGELRIEILDMDGKIVKTRHVQFTQKYALDLRELPDGIYLVAISDNKGNSVTKKLVKIKEE